MKKISVVLISLILSVDGWAENGAPANTAITYGPSGAVVQNIAKSKNPNTKFPRGLQFGFGVSPTSGLNGFIGYNNKKFDSFWAKRFGIRFDFATYSPIKNRLNRKINNSIGTDGVKIEDNLNIENLELNAKHYGALVDFYPFGDTWFLGGWRVSGGYITGNMNLNADIHGKNTGSGIEFELNNKKYNYSGDEMHGNARLDWKYHGPYLGTGFDLGLFLGIKIFMDAGVVFADKSANINLDVPYTDLYDSDNNPVIEGTASGDVFEEDKAAEMSKAQKELDKYPYYPLVKIGFMYRF